jgi:hypothetical protein
MTLNAHRQLSVQSFALAPNGKVASDEMIDELVHKLNELQRGATLEIALRMGKLIVNHFYGGDLTAWRKHTTKEASFRKLAARANVDLRISATSLFRSVAIYELTERLGPQNLRHFSVTQLRLVLGLPEDEQRRLLVAAETKGWPTDRLEQETARIRSTLSSRQGRPAVLPLVRAIRSLATHAQQAREMISSSDYVTPLSREQLRDIYRSVEDVKARMEQFQRILLGTDRTLATESPRASREAVDRPRRAHG